MGKKRKSASKPEAASSSKPKLFKPQPPPPPADESEEEEEEEHVESEPEEVEAEEEEESSSSSSSSSESEEEEEEAAAAAEEESDDKSSSSSSSSSSEEEEEEEEEEEDDDTKRNSIKKLLEPFGKDQLIAILKEAALKTPSIIDHITKTVDSDPIQRKIFVHGLAWDTNCETLAAAFKPFGPIEECKVVSDKITNRSKGYGFILFKTSASARKALKQPQKKIGSRMAVCQLASSGANQSHQQQQPQSQPNPASGRRLYVANVGPHIAPEKFKAFFAEFGELEDGPVALGGLDKDTGKFKGFAILVYKSVEGVKKALEEPVKFFQGNKLQCSVATEGRSVNKNNNSNSNSNDAKANNVVATSVPGVAPTLPVAAFNPALVGQAFNPAQAFNPGAVFMAQNPALGVMNLNHVGFGFPGGVSQPLNRVGNAPNPMGLTQLSAGGFGAQPPINSISPSVIGSYGAQAALQGLGVYQSSQMTQSSAVPRSQTGAAPVGTMPPYLGR